MSAPALAQIRRSVWLLAADDQTLPYYARAVETMQGRKADDPTSWTYQAAMHGTTAAKLQPLWDQCKHGSWFFLAWHRWFIYYFEQIVREAVIAAGGSDTWALPYWDYGLGGSDATLPPAFRSPTSGNPLYTAERAPGMNAGNAMPPPVIDESVALGRPNFTGAPEFGGGVGPAGQQFWSETGRLEQTPHNDVHVTVGGADGLMSFPEKAAQDPIFWLHHANIDRIWDAWNEAGHTDPSDARWATQSFEFFDAQGQRVQRTCAEAVDIDKLGYRYGPRRPMVGRPTGLRPPILVSGPPPDPGQRTVVGATKDSLTLSGSTAEARVGIDQAAHRDAIQASGAANPRVYLNLEDVEGERNPGVVYGVYVNVAPDADDESLAAHHVGNLSFFGLERAKNPREGEHPHSLRFSMDITELVQQLRSQGQWDDHSVSVTIKPLQLVTPEDATPAAPVPAAATERPVTVGRVSLSYG